LKPIVPDHQSARMHIRPIFFRPEAHRRKKKISPPAVIPAADRPYIERGFYHFRNLTVGDVHALARSSVHDRPSDLAASN